MINCSENCFHEEDGLCTLKEATKPSSTPIKDCPYFKEKCHKKSR
ncbi:hydroxymyristoyl-ACP dehydratase [Wansuia hejianensis]|uniref:Hydroxymyristoyl-ACP dehydratase n=1 Tax=Wansuia hejianensis TaxID=2763667 RepID=A0A926IL64_9FIRM|nr:hydroxymyristoyl-ACP dehydratase [Wansuia hejianensis]MBC8589799.1 hydroxymyristoyl-ACP dehydratase [Wansuia hejianensis]